MSVLMNGLPSLKACYTHLLKVQICMYFTVVQQRHSVECTHRQTMLFLDIPPPTVPGQQPQLPISKPIIPYRIHSHPNTLLHKIKCSLALSPQRIDKPLLHPYRSGPPLYFIYACIVLVSACHPPSIPLRGLEAVTAHPLCRDPCYRISSFVTPPPFFQRSNKTYHVVFK
jgi:hypothetical protein